ncbi:hypothetical protein [Sporichthya sp.]|uniref:hypothetical protein n=1 Tax=Sporichthya sp. TaxID=65475 RepID=UPI0017D786F1|nr:hypothetical protein [Sporichthya sp.]MBA3742289.1 hypothetical protein [Sporichthya sp.]
MVIQTTKGSVTAWAVQAAATALPNREQRPSRVRAQLEELRAQAVPDSAPVTTGFAWQHHVVIALMSLVPAVVHALA